jgi:uncharacterized protein with HEPN domain
MPRDPAEVQRHDRIRMTHMLAAARRARDYCGGMTCETLEADEMRFLAVVKSIEMIGEAASKVCESTQSRIAAIDWSGVRRMRNRLIHGYDSIDPERIWDAVQIDLPPLIAALEAELPDRPRE